MKNREKYSKNKAVMLFIAFLLVGIFIVIATNTVHAGSSNGENFARAVLANESWLIDSSYTDTDEYGTRQAMVLSSLGTMSPTNGNSFLLISTGIAGSTPATTNEWNPGDERGSWFDGGKTGYPRDEATLIMTLQVPEFMHYLYYDVQFFSSEYPEWVGSVYNDKLTVTVNSPSYGSTSYVFDVNSGYFVLESDGLPGTGFDLYATSGYPGGVDWVGTNYIAGAADAGASDLIPIGGSTHPVSPLEIITVTINIKDTGDNVLDSAAFIDNLMFTGYAKADIVARKTVQDLNGDDVKQGDTLKYTVTISNTGGALQRDNPGYEFEDSIPNNCTYVSGSVTATSGTVQYLSGDDKVVWDGSIDPESSVSLTFQVMVNGSLSNSSLIRNQGTVYWDDDGSYPFDNEAIELTDDPHSDDGIDSDGDGETDDDDPTDLYVFCFEAPTEVTEGFSDDERESAAEQSYMGRMWFNTSYESGESNFEVVDGYFDDTPKSFKTKMRYAGSPQYWYYNITSLEGCLSAWEIDFKCGNATEQSELIADFVNSDGQSIAKLKFSYVHEGLNNPVDWVVKLSYWSPSISNWKEFNTDTQGYLFNHWYNLRIEINDEFHITYILTKKDVGPIDSVQDLSLEELITTYVPGSLDSNLAYIKWENSLNPVVCPMFFWDDLRLELN